MFINVRVCGGRARGKGSMANSRLGHPLLTAVSSARARARGNSGDVTTHRNPTAVPSNLLMKRTITDELL
jgi:hypothetical protein